MKIYEQNFTLEISKSLIQKHLGAIRNTIKSDHLQGIDTIAPSLKVIESDQTRLLPTPGKG